MKGLLILVALCPVLFADPPVSPPGSYQCQEDQDQKAIDEAVHFINERHHHGYKFKLAHVDGRSVEKAEHPCVFVLGLTLDETTCHVLNTKPFNECEARQHQEVNITAKCNVTICGGGDEPGIKRFSCDTEPEPNEKIAVFCPDCPSLLPLNDSRGLESVHAAVEKYNNDTSHASYFRLLEVGRISTQYNPMFGMSYFAEFAIVETECSDKPTEEEKPACKPKCPHEVNFGFCKSTQLGNDKLFIDCTIYENSTRHPHPPFHHGKHCGHHKERPHPPGHHDHEEDETKKGSSGAPEHEPPGHDKHFHSGCFIRSSHPHHRGPPHHGHHRDHGRPHHHGHGRDKGHHDHHDGHHRGHHHEHQHDHKKPHQRPGGPHPSHPIPPGHRDRPFPPCHGAVKSQPSIHPICPFPPKFHIRGHHE
ncbi:alpha-2-HS-glycoprotein 1 [Trichomycterus rosablanca]|uniref:alpha-2-HS-glycoprotein 1 n=1 Tax=Trichomycterus rosablanca TaxID=2290929 RepID=UPI002F360DB2